MKYMLPTILLFLCCSACLADKQPDAVYVPTPQPVVEMMLDLAEVERTDVLYDLGCGDGRIVVTAAKKFGCRAAGFDVDPQRIKDSLENVEKNKVQKLVRIEQKDIFTLDLSKASVITLYLLPKLNTRLIPQLEKMRPGSRIVSHDFDIKGAKPFRIARLRLKAGDGYHWHVVYLYVVPFRFREGRK